MTLLCHRAPLDEIVKKIVASLRPGTESSGLGEVSGLVEAAHRVREQADVVRAHLRFLLSDPDHFAQAAQRAYWHVNGFLKLRLASHERFCLRLHIWPPGENRRGDTEPHSHRWDFASWVAVGPGLAETYFARTDSDDPEGRHYVHYEYGRTDTDDPRLHKGGVVWLRTETIDTRTAGTVYGCPHQIIHTVTPMGSDLIATVLLQGPEATRTTAVFRPYRHRDFPVLERSVETDELAALIGAVEEAFTGCAVV